MLLAWWKSVNWIEWLDYKGCVERPTEDAAIRVLASKQGKAERQLASIRELLFRDVVKEVLREEYQRNHDLPLRSLHAKRGYQLEWVDLNRDGVLHCIHTPLTKTA